MRRPVPIKSNKLISVTQFSPSYRHDFVDIDTFMIDLVPLNQNMNEVMFQSFNLPTVLRRYITVVTWEECAPEILLYGEPIGARFFPPSSDGRLEFARIEVGAGLRVLSSENSDFELLDLCKAGGKKSDYFTKANRFRRKFTRIPRAKR